MRTPPPPSASQASTPPALAALPAGATLVDVLLARAAATPTRRAFTFLRDGEEERDQLSYGELDARARHAAGRLLAAGAAGERALLLHPPGLELVVAFLACLYAGVTAVPAYPPRSRRGLPRLAAMVQDAEPALALTTAGELARLQQLAARVPGLGALRWMACGDAADGAPTAEARQAVPRLPTVEAADLAFLQYTSGSTATPRGVRVTHGNLMQNEAAIHRAFGVTAEAVIVSWLPLYHDMGLIGGVLQPLYAGAQAVLMAPAAFLQRPARWLQAISRFSATISGGPDFAYDLCARQISPVQRQELLRGGLDLSSWRVAFNGAEPVRAATLDRFAAAFADCGFQHRAFFPCYGLAESTLFVSGAGGGGTLSLDAAALEAHTVRPADADSPGSRAVVSCGPLGDNQQALVVDAESRQPVEGNAVGEIWLAGPSTTDGYWRRPAASERTFGARLASGEGPYLRSGDLGFLHHGQLFVTGRRKDLIVIRGRNCYPQDLEETAVTAHPDLRPGGGAAFSVEHDGQERLVMLHEVERGQRGDGAAIAAAIRGALAEAHELQAHEVVLLRAGTLPRTSSGKVQRHACRQHYLADTLETLGRRAVVARSATAVRTLDAGGQEGEEEEILGRDALLALAPAARRHALEDYLGRRAAQAAGVPGARLDRHAPLVNLGLDSLAAVGLAHDVATDLGVELPFTALLGDASLASAAARIALLMEEAVDEGAAPAGEELASQEPEEDGATFPLSDGQRGLCFLDELAPNSAAYVMAMAVRIRHEIDADALRQALQELVRRHGALRTTLHAGGGQDHQRVHADLELAVPLVPAAGWSEARLKRFLDDNGYQTFDLGQAPLMRASLIARTGGGQKEHILLVGIHHAVADFWSLTLLARDLGVLYAAARGVEGPALAALPASYGGLVRQQQARLDGDEGDRLWAYWQQAVAGADTVLELPTDRPRPAVMTHSGGARNLWLGRQTSARVRALSRAQGTTLYTTLLAAFSVLLHRLSGQHDFLIGSPTAGRDAAVSAQVVGYFVNPVVMRADLRPTPEQGAPSFTTVLARSRDTVLGALAHQTYPLQRLTERLQPERDPSRSALFQVMFVLQRVPRGERQRLAAIALGEPGIEIEIGPRLTVESMHLEERASPFELVLRSAWIDDEILLSAHYNTDLFDAATMARLLRHFRRLLAAAAAKPGQAIGDLPLLEPAEAAQIVVEWNDTAAALDGAPIDRQVAWQAARTPGAPAVVGAQGVLTYGELLARADRLAHHLRGLGVGAETRVGILMPRTPALVAALLGVLRAGAAYVPLDPAYPRQRLALMLADSRAAVVVAEGELARAAADTLEGTAVVHLEEGWPVAEAPAAAEEDFGHREDGQEDRHDLNSLAYVLYTSGSTGRPKGVAIPHRGPAALAAWARRAFPHRDWRGMLAATSICFDLSVFEIFVPLTAGGTVVMAANALALPAAAAAASAAGGALTLINTVPSVLAELLRLSPLPPSVRTVCLAGEPLPRALVAQLYALPFVRRVYDLYGPSEDTTYSTAALQPRRAEARPTIGRPLAGGRALVLDAQLAPVAIGAVGELCLAGDGLARGYFGQPTLTAGRFVPDPHASAAGGRLYRSGDLARQRPDGALLFLGRGDHQVKVRGFRIELGEVEAGLACQPDVEEAVVLVDAGGDRLVGFVAMPLSEADEAVRAAALRQGLRQRLPEHMVPAVIAVRAALPRLPNGKIDRRALGTLATSATATDLGASQEAAPASAVEEILAAIWSDLLGLERVDPETSFFDLGGHSLLATRLLSRLREALGVELPLLAIFEAPTLRRLGTRVEAARAEAAALPATPPLLPRQDAATAPASYAQERLWFFHRLAPGSAAYNLPAPLRLRGALDPGLLAHAVNVVVARHEALRTLFVEVEAVEVAGGDPKGVGSRGETVRQQVMPPAEVALPLIDLRPLASAAAPTAQRLAAAEVRRPFDLARAPLLRLLLLRLGDDDHLLVATFHHVVADAWSLGVWWREVLTAYQALVEDDPPALAALPALPVQYGDFAHWQRQALQGDLLASRVEAWRQRLEGLPDLALDGDRPRPARRRFRGGVVACDLPATLHSALEGLVRRQDVTLFMVLLAGLQALLFRLSGQPDLAVGAPVAGRDHSRLDGLIGFFVNTVVLRGRLAGGASFQQLLERTRHLALEAYALQDAPFEKLVEALAPQRHLGSTPLFQVMLALQNAPRPAPRVGALTLAPVDVHTGTAKFDLTWIFEPALAGGQGLRGRLEYDADLFDATTAQRLTAQLRTLLDAAADDPQRSIDALPLLSPAARHQLSVEHARGVGAADPSADLPSLFAARVAETPDALAIVDGATPGDGPRALWSYGHLGRRASELARRLRGRGVGAETVVGLCLERGAELVMAMLAVVEAGGAYLPLAPGDPPARLEQVLADAGASLVLTTSALAARLPASIPALCLDAASSRDETVPSQPGAEPRPRSAARLAYVMYTSGSTGRPKGVAVPHHAIVRLVRRPGFADLGREHVFLQLAPPTFDAATLEIWGPLLNGGRLVVPPPGPLSPAELRRLVARHGITTLWLTAGLFHRLAAEPLAGLEGLRQLLAGGDVTQPAAVEHVLQGLPGLTFIHGYGPTENTTFTTCCRLHRAADAALAVLPLGAPIAGTEVLVLDRRGRPVPHGVPGELVTGGDGLARGYWRRPGRTATVFRPHPRGTPGARLYHSGDLVRRRGDGRLEFLGRVDAQLKVRGFRIEPGEVEAVLSSHPAVAACAVAARPDPAGDKRLLAWVVPAPGHGSPQDGGLDSEALARHLARRLPRHLVPDLFVPLDALTLTANGKVDRRALPAPEPVRPAAAGALVAPRSPHQAAVVAVFAEVLGLAAVGAEDDFFALGGNSLAATRVVARLRRSLGVEVPLAELFAAPTVAGLAAEVARLQGGREASGEAASRAAASIPRRPTDAPAPLSYAQARLWLVDRLRSGGHPGYVVTGGVSLRGALQPALLAAALNAMVRRHETLRTTFAMTADGPVQLIAPAAAATLPLAIVDLGALPTGRQEQVAAGWGRRESRHFFDLERGPLLRTTLLRRADDHHLLWISLHHAIADGWSVTVLIRELAVLYRAAAAGTPDPLPPLPIQYADYAHWQRSWLESGEMSRQLAAWRQRLAGVPTLELPTDRPRPTLQSGRGARRPLAVPAARTAALEGLATRHGTTLFVTLMTVFQTLLHRLSGQTDIAVGFPIAGRTRTETEGLVGCLVNLLVLRGDLAGDPPFAALLARFHTAALAAYAHQDLPFERLVEEINPQRDLSQNPLVQVSFGLQNAPLALAAAGTGLQLARFDADPGSAALDLYVSLWQLDGTLGGHAEYDSDLFDATTVERLMRRYATLLQAVSADPSSRLSHLRWLAAAEAHQLVVEWNDNEPGRDARYRLPPLLARSVETLPDAVAVVADDGLLTYAALARRVAALCHRLRAAGVGPETLVGVALERGLAQVTAVLAVIEVGGAYVPFDPDYPAERLALLAADSGIAVVIARQPLPAWLADTTARVIEPEEGSRSTDVTAAPAPFPPPDNALAYAIYTSGSTGRPKGVMIGRHHLAHFFTALDRWFAVRGDEVWIALASLSFDISALDLLWTLSRGLRVVIDPRPMGGEPLVARLEKHRITHLQSTPPLISTVLMEPGWIPRLRALRRLLIGGEVWPSRLATNLLTHTRAEVFNIYGPTEVTIWTTYHLLTDTSEPIPIGRSLPARRAHVVDRRLRPTPMGVPGELMLGGEGVARGYLRRPGLSATRFVPDPWSRRPGRRLYCTGDVVRWLPDGTLDFLGRVDRQVKIRGYRIELGEVEVVARRHPAVAEAAAVAWGQGGDRRLVLYVAAKEDAELDSADLRTFLAAQLPAYMVPGEMPVLDALPRMPNGKTDYKRLPAPETAIDDRPFAPPKTALEQQVAAVWRHVLSRPQVGVDESFFEIGGSSLSLVRVHRELEAVLGRKLALVNLFRYPSVGALATFLEEEAGDAGGGEAGTAVRRTDRAQQRGDERGRRQHVAAAHLATLATSVAAVRQRRPGQGATSTASPEDERGDRQQLPNGLEVIGAERSELLHFYDDIFVRRVYLRHGLTLPEDAVVFDVGANVGLFTLFVQQLRPQATVFAFEPVPPLFALLQANTRRHAPRARLFPSGVGAAEGVGRVTFYPRSSGMSSFHAHEEEERALLQTLIRNEAAEGMTAAQALLPHLDDYVTERLRHETYESPLTTLSAVIRQQRVERIDLLKIDAQKSEAAIIAGIEDEDWPRLRQLVLEVHDTDGRLAQLTSQLADRGFTVTADQEALYADTGIHLLYARRPQAPRAAAPARTFDADALARIRARARQQRQALTGAAPEPPTPPASDED